MTTFDVAIVGAGIVGAACAASLAAEGLKVAVIESRGVASGTTSAGMGHIVVMDDSEAQFALTRYSQALWNALEPKLPGSAEFEHCGTIWVAADDDEMQEVRRKHEFYAERGIASEILDEHSLRAAEPNLRQGLAGGLLVKSDSVVYQPRATRYLIESATASGAELKIGARAMGISSRGVKLENGDLIAARKVVNAAGIAANAIRALLGTNSSNSAISNPLTALERTRSHSMRSHEAPAKSCLVRHVNSGPTTERSTTIFCGE